VSQEYVTALSDAFETTGTLDMATLMRAVKFLNFEHSSSDDQDAIRACPLLNAGHAEADSFPCRTSTGLGGRIGAGSAIGGNAVLYGFQLAKRFLPDPGNDVAKLEKALRSEITGPARVRQFRRYWNGWADDERFFWVAQHSTTPDPARLGEIVSSLGLFHWGMVTPGDAVVMLTYDVAERKKPTWIDADLTFYFDVCADVADHGFTRCLRTGQRHYPEWIARKKHLAPTDVRLLRLSDIIDLGAPSGDYWQVLRNDVELARAVP
jgi:hypothetical protein